MKKHTIILFLSLTLLVVSEYFFFTEIYAERRPSVLAITLIATIASISLAVHSFKLIYRNNAE